MNEDSAVDLVLTMAPLPPELPLVLAGGQVFDGTGRPPFKGDVVVSGNRIEAIIADGESAATPDGAIRLELDGRTVLPGLVEGHAHISFTNMSNLMESGVDARGGEPDRRDP